MKSRHVFGRHNAADMPAAIAGDGCFIIDQDGNRYLDGSGGAAVSCLGHSDMAVRDAMLAQAGSLSFAHTAFFTSHPAEKLAERLAGLAPEGVNRV